MAFSGFKNREIAERLSMSECTISGILRSPLGQAYMGGLHDKSKENTLDVRKQLIAMNSSALDAFTRILSPAGKAPYAVQFNTAKDILDRNGFKPTDKINIDMTLQSKSDDEIDAEINALKNSIARAAATAATAATATAVAEQADDVAEPSSSNTFTDSSEGSSISLSPLSQLTTELAQDSIDSFPPK